MKSKFSRRRFIRNASFTLGAAAVGIPTSALQAASANELISTSRMVTIGTISVMELTAPTSAEMIQKVLGIMEGMTIYKPDIICLPEVFAFTNIGEHYNVKDVAEQAPGAVVTPFLKFAATHHCYVICPTYTLSKGNIYISAVLIDRQGKVMGEYHKMRPTDGEMENGVKPGELEPPVFETDFGRIGIQICFDIKYDEGWNALKEKGAEIIFWPSAYAAGREISSMAWRHQVYIVSSTQKDTSKICDLTGEPVVQTGRWQRNWACGQVNLEKAFIPTWPAVAVFPRIQKKYGTKIALTTCNEEEWTIIESLDKDVKIADVLKEFNLKNMHDTIRDLATLHDRVRK